VIFEPGNKHLFLDISSTNRYTSPIALPVRRNPQHRSILIGVSATSTHPFQPLHQRNVCYGGGILTDQTDGSHYGPSPGCKADVQKVPNVVLEFSPVLLGLYLVWHCHNKDFNLKFHAVTVFKQHRVSSILIRPGDESNYEGIPDILSRV
jgi:hypothetical protein